MHNHFEQERHVEQVIAKYHRQPIEAAQFREARSSQTNPVIAISLHLRARLSALLTTSGSQQESPAFVEPAPEPVDSTATP
jgi:hypothetical protein